MPAILVGLADFTAAALAALEAVAAFLLACAAIYMWLGLIRPIFHTTAHFLPGGWSVFGQTIVPNLRQDWLNLEAAVYQGLLDWRKGSEIEVAFTWHWMAQAWRWNAGMVEWLAAETATSVEWLAHVRTPKWFKWVLYGSFPPLLIAKLVKAVLPHLRLHTSQLTTYITQTFPKTVVRIGPKAIAAAFPGIADIPWIEREVYGLTKRNLGILRRLRSLEALLTVAGFAAVLAKVWGVSLRCVRHNGPIGRAARGLCSMESWLLDFLFLGAVEAFIATDLCAFSDLLIKQAEAIRPALMELVDVEDALIGCHGASKPLVFKLPAASLPPLQGISPLAA